MAEDQQTQSQTASLSSSKLYVGKEGRRRRSNGSNGGSRAIKSIRGGPEARSSSKRWSARLCGLAVSRRSGRMLQDAPQFPPPFQAAGPGMIPTTLTRTLIHSFPPSDFLPTTRTFRNVGNQLLPVGGLLQRVVCDYNRRRRRRRCGVRSLFSSRLLLSERAAPQRAPVVERIGLVWTLGAWSPAPRRRLLIGGFGR